DDVNLNTLNPDGDPAAPASREGGVATPAARGYAMPAEWAPHRGTWLSWPHRESSWPGNFAPVPAVMAAFVRELAVGEEVHINVADAAMEASARRELRATGTAAGNV